MKYTKDVGFGQFGFGQLSILPFWVSGKLIKKKKLNKLMLNINY